MTSNQVCQALSVSPRIVQWACERKLIDENIQGHVRNISREEALVLGIARQLSARKIAVRMPPYSRAYGTAFRVARRVVKKFPAPGLVCFCGPKVLPTSNMRVALRHAAKSAQPVSIVDVGAIVQKIDGVLLGASQ